MELWRTARFGISLLLVGNVLWALLFASEGVAPNSNGRVGFFSAPRPPVLREDRVELAALARHLAATTGPEDRILVVGSSFVLNQDLLRVVMLEELQRPDLLERFVWGPEVDHNQKPPYDAFATATVYLVPDPAQYHLDPEGQKVITASARQFPPPADRAALFARDPAVFALQEGVRVSVWRRRSWTPRALRTALEAIHAVAGDGGALPGWVVLESSGQAMAEEGADGMATLRTAGTAPEVAASFFHASPVGGGRHRLALTLRSNGSACVAPRVRIAAQDATGRVVLESVALEVEPKPTSRPAVELPEGAAFWLTLHLEARARPGEPCALLLEGLRVEKAP